MLHEGLSIKLKAEEVQPFYKHNAMLHYTYTVYLACLWLILRATDISDYTPLKQ